MYFVEEDKEKDEEPGWCRTREEMLKEVKSKPLFDIVVIGGGIHGACFARLAAYNGFKVLLVEKKDYAFGTSSRTSKMAHGGLRYLEIFDLKQVKEGLKARDELLKTAPHLVKIHNFLVPIDKSKFFDRVRIKFGLSLYDLLGGKRIGKHSWYPAESRPLVITLNKTSEWSGAYEYLDGLMNDTRLVIENIISAIQEGAFCINYCEWKYFKRTSDGELICTLYDNINKEEFEVKAGAVVNCAGPWVKEMPGFQGLKKKILFSQGIHLLFDVSWNGPAFLMPKREKPGYYFVWPFLGKVLVGTTERVVSEIPEPPTPTEEEIKELFSYIKRDFNTDFLPLSKAYYAYAGVRTLYNSTNRPSIFISRRPRWVVHGSVLTLIGGKFTTANLTALEGLKLLFKAADIRDRSLIYPEGRLLPGAGLLRRSVDEFLLAGRERGIPDKLLYSAINRFGSRVRYITQNSSWFEPIGNSCLVGEVMLSIKQEQALTINDVLKRRLLVQYLPDKGIGAIGKIKEILKNILKKQEAELDKEEEQYKKRLKEVDGVLERARGGGGSFDCD
ncbi:MAG: FAD-dependent oxidoreductase [Candidatus Dadabacteria bacterium]|nr:MAG: FAD-dependent oxidoreductase [Candidatus Dadabacteria bacterium]